MRTLLVDSSYLLKRSFHGARDLQTSKFGHIGGLYQYMTTLRNLIKTHGINKVICVWDGENGGIYRYRIDSNYKSNRKSKEWFKKIELTQSEINRENNKEESLLKQRKRIQSYSEELFIRQIEVDEIEADDIIAEYCIRMHEKEDIYIFSNDRDYSQLLDLNISIIFPNINQVVTKTNYLMYFNHHYSNALTVKIICGDTSDNIKGIKGMGEDTLLKYFPELKYRHLSVKEICKKAISLNESRVTIDKKKPIAVLNNLVNSIDKLKTNHRLTNLRQPFLNDLAINEIELCEIPLSPDGRSSSNLYKMMIEDDFLSIYSSSFTSYVEPFYTVIMHEKDIYNNYYEK